MAEMFVEHRATVQARNRRGAEPLHYAADGNPELATWNPDAQQSIIEYLIKHGADPNARDNSGVAALHRAVRNRCSPAVTGLLDNGADPTMANKNGSTPLHLAMNNTGRSGSGSSAAKDQQQLIIELSGSTPRRRCAGQRYGLSTSDCSTGVSVAGVDLAAGTLYHLAISVEQHKVRIAAEPERDGRVGGWAVRHHGEGELLVGEPL